MATRLAALEVMQGAVAFDNSVIVKPGFLKLPIHIRGENEAAMDLARGDIQQLPKTRVRNGAAVQIQPMTVESPRQFGRSLEPVRMGHLLEAHAEFGQRRISLPETIGAAKVGKTRINAH